MRCFFCKKHINLINFQCRCGNTYCSKHGFFDDHFCTVDQTVYSNIGKSKLTLANPKIIAKQLNTD